MPTWAKWVEKATEGRVKIIIPPKSLAPPPQQWASVEKGIADTAFQFNGFIANRVWGPTVAMQPFIATHDSQAMSQALWETYEKYFPHEYKGVHLLSLWVITPAELWSQTDKPVNSMADLKSRKIWALPGTNAAIMKAVGAGVVSGPAVQMNEIVSRGVVDAYVGVSPASVRDFRLIPYTKSMTQFSRGIYSTSFSFLMSEKKWDALSKKDQDAITVGERRQIRPHDLGLLDPGRQGIHGRAEEGRHQDRQGRPAIRSGADQDRRQPDQEVDRDRQQARHRRPGGL